MKTTKMLTILVLALASVANASDPNLVGWWKLDRDVNDSSGNGLNGTISGSVTYVAGPTYGDNLPFYSDNNAISLPGGVGGPYVDFGGGVGEIGKKVISNLGDCSFLIWVNFRTSGGALKYTPIFEFGTADNNYMRLCPRNSSSPPTHFAIITGGATQVVGYSTNELSQGSIITADTWHHVAVTISDPNSAGTRTFRLYVDGQQVGVNTAATFAPSNLGTTTTNCLGRNVYSGGSTPSNYAGWLDDFRIYNRVLSQAEIRALLAQTKKKGTAFMHQERLLDNNTQANGLYDFRLKLYGDLILGAHRVRKKT
jgi:hypothetical protein